MSIPFNTSAIPRRAFLSLLTLCLTSCSTNTVSESNSESDDPMLENTDDYSTPRHDHDDNSGNGFALSDWVQTRKESQSLFDNGSVRNQIIAQEIDHDGRVISWKQITGGTIEFERHFEYDHNGNLHRIREIEFLDDNQQLVSETVFDEYDAEGKYLHSYLESSTENYLYTAEEFLAYDEQSGTVTIRRISSGAAGENDYTDTYSYYFDADGQLVFLAIDDSIASVDRYEDRFGDKHTDCYDVHGNLIQSIWLVLYDDGSTAFRYDVLTGDATGYAYDNQGNIVEEAGFRSSELLWIKHNTYHSGLLSESSWFNVNRNEPCYETRTSYEYTNFKTRQTVSGRDPITLALPKELNVLTPFQDYMLENRYYQVEEHLRWSVGYDGGEWPGSWHARGGEFEGWGFDLMGDGSVDGCDPDANRIRGTWEELSSPLSILVKIQNGPSFVFTMTETGGVHIELQGGTGPGSELEKVL